MRRLLLVAALLSAGAHATEVGNSLQINPVVVYFKLPAGESARQVFTIGNTGANPLFLSVSRRDAWHAPDGSRTFPEPGGSPQGLAKWLSAPNPARLRVPPKGTVRFEGTVTVPPGTPPRTYLGGYVLRLEESDGTGKDADAAKDIRAGARMTPAIVLLVHVDVREPGSPAPSAHVEILDQAVEAPQGARPLTVRLLLRNRDEYEVKPVGTLAIFDRSGKIVGKASFGPVQLWPGQQAWYEAKFAEPLAAGSYAALAAFSLQDPSGSGEAYSAPPVQRKIEFAVESGKLAPPARPAPLPGPAKNGK